MKGVGGWWNYPIGSGRGAFDRLRMGGKRLRMKVLVDEDGLEDYDAIALSNQGFVSAAARKKRV